MRMCFCFLSLKTKLHKANISKSIWMNLTTILRHTILSFLCFSLPILWIFLHYFIKTVFLLHTHRTFIQLTIYVMWLWVKSTHHTCSCPDIGFPWHWIGDLHGFSTVKGWCPMLDMETWEKGFGKYPEIFTKACYFWINWLNSAGTRGLGIFPKVVFLACLVVVIPGSRASFSRVFFLGPSVFHCLRL